tara:strand:- start:1390 stop:2691 length:1302 start_codon:yes stop_codon:yes gene_type:complete
MVRKPRPESGDWISDAPRLLGPTVRKQLNQRMTELDESGRGQMAIVLLDNIGSGNRIGDVSAFGRFTEEVFDLWGVGRRGINDGVVLSVYLEGRRVEVRTGSGARKVLPDAWLQRMQQREMVPLFRAGQRAEAVERGAHLILDELEGLPPLVAHEVEGGKITHIPENGAVDTPSKKIEPRPAAFGNGRAVVKPRSSDERAQAETGEIQLAVLVGLVFAFIGLCWYWEREAEKKRRRCFSCSTPDLRVVMDTVASDLDGTDTLENTRWLEGPEALTPCNLDERCVGAVRFELLRCPKCGGERVLQTESYGWSRCTGCNCRTEKERTYTQVAATYDHGGVELHKVDCHHCSRHHQFTTSTPKKERRQQSSGSSGGGFGGGSSSGGGGAGASWLVEGAEDWLDTPPSVLMQLAVTRGRKALSWDVPPPVPKEEEEA